MEIDRLSKIREVCFKNKGNKNQKSKPPKKNTRFQLYQQSQDLSSLDSSNYDYQKENLFTQVKQNDTLSNQTSTLKANVKSRSKDPLKRYEEIFKKTIQSKQQRLENSVNMYKQSQYKKDKIKLQRLQEEKVRISSCSPNRKSRARSYKSTSPIKQMSTNKNNSMFCRQRSNSPQNFYQSQIRDQRFKSPNSGFELYKVQEFQCTQDFACSQLIEKNNKEELNFQSSEQLKNILLQFIDKICQQNKWIYTQEIINEQQIQELKLRIIGSFERLCFTSNQDIKQQILEIVQGCFTDLFFKIEQNVLQDQNVPEHLISYTSMIDKITEQIYKVNLEEIIPLISKQLQDLRIALLIKILQNSINKSNNKCLIQSFNRISQLSNKRQLLNQSMRSIFVNNSKSKNQVNLTQAFNIWRRKIDNENIKQQLTVKSNYNIYIKNLMSNTSFISFYFSETVRFIEAILDIPFDYVDIIIMKLKGDQSNGYSYDTHSSIKLDNQKIKLDFQQPSLIKSMLNSQELYQEQITIKRDFNHQVDLPIGISKDILLKKSLSISQLIVPLFKQDSNSLIPNKSLRMIIRFTYKNKSISQQQQVFVQQKINNISFDIINAYEQFSKLNKMVTQIQIKLDEMNNNSMISDGKLNNIQYLQQKSLELNYISNASDVFNFLNGISMELFGYDKCQIYQHNNSNDEITKLYDASCKQKMQQIKQIGEKNDRLFKDLMNDANKSNKDNINSYIYKQFISESEDKLSINGKQIKDQVIILLQDNQNQNQTYINNGQSMSDITLSQVINNQNIQYFIKLEKKLNKSSEQIPFNEKLSSFFKIQNLKQIFLIAIYKIITLSQNPNLDQTVEIQQNQSNSIISLENEELKKMIKFQQEIEQLFNSMKQCQNIQNSFEEFEQMLHEFIIKYIIHASYFKLFISKDEQGQQLYTYRKGIINAQNSLLCTSKFQSTFPQNIKFDKHNQDENTSHIDFNKQNILYKRHNSQQRLKQIRPHSQITTSNNINNNDKQCNANNLMFPSHLEDISSISADEEQFQSQNVRRGEGSKNEKNSILLNTFSQEIITGNQAMLQQMSQLPSAQNLVSKSCRNQNSMIKNKIAEQLKRQTSNFSDIKSCNQMQIKNQFNELIKEQRDSNEQSFQQQVQASNKIKKVIALSSYDEILNDLKSNEFEITSNCGNYGKINIKPFEQKCILQTAFKEQYINQKNVKNSKDYNKQIDGMILQTGFQNESNNNEELTQSSIIENLLYYPIVYQNQEVCGIFQIANCDKAKPFSEIDIEYLGIFAKRMSQFLVEYKELFVEKVLFKKQLEASLMSTSLENQSVTKILSLANKLFQSKIQPLKALGIFMRKTERYMRKFFTCQMSQILLIDSEKQNFVSFDYANNTQQLVVRGMLSEQSIASFMMAQTEMGLPQTFRFPVNNLQQYQDNYIFIGDQDNLMINTGAQYFNSNIDMPARYVCNTNLIPSSYMALPIKDDTNQIICIVQLIQKQNGLYFSEQDIRHLQIINSHLQKIFCYVLQSGYLNQNFISDEIQNKLQKMVKIINKKYKSNLKLFFREILQYKYGKQNVLKNKIIRKYIDQQFNVDQKFEQQLERLQVIVKQYQTKHKNRALKQLKLKIQQIHQKRQQKALKCVQVVNKYSNLLQIRIKDAIFRQWNALKYISNQNVLMNNQTINQQPLLTSFGNPFNINNEYNDKIQSNQYKRNQNNDMRETFSNSSFFNSNIKNNKQQQQSSNSFLESSITSILFMQAKQIYKLKKIFNEKKLRVFFDLFMIKSLQKKNDSSIKNILQNKRCLFKIKCSRIFKNFINKQQGSKFNILKQKTQTSNKQLNVLKKQLSKKMLIQQGFGIRKWKQFCEQKISKELKVEKEYSQMLNGQCKDYELFAQIIAKVNKIIQSNDRIKSAQEVIELEQFQNLFKEIADFLKNSFEFCDHVVITFKVQSDQYQGKDIFVLGSYPCGIKMSLLPFSLKVILNSNNTCHSSHYGSIQEAIEVNQKNIYGTFQQLLNNKNIIQQQSKLSEQNNIENNSKKLIFVDSKDLIIQSLIQSRSSFIVSSLDCEKDHLLKDSLYAREITINNNYKEACFIPFIIDKNEISLTNSNQYQQNNEIIGTLEIYNKSSQISVQGSNRLQQIANIIVLGLTPLQHYLKSIEHVTPFIQKQNLLQSQITNQQLQLETLNDYDKVNIQSVEDNDVSFSKFTSTKQQIPKTFSQIIHYKVVEKILKSLKANHCNLIFIPEQYKEYRIGLFYNFKDSQIYSLDFKQTFLEELIFNQENGQRQLTFPSSLICQVQSNSKSPSKFGINQKESFEAITGEKFEAIKYFSIPKVQDDNQNRSNEIIAFVEIGWNFLTDAENLHQNYQYLYKKESQIKNITQKTMKKYSQKIKFFIMILSKFINKQEIQINTHNSFQIWKNQTYFNTEVRQNTIKNSWEIITNKKEYYNQKQLSKQQITDESAKSIFIPTIQSIHPYYFTPSKLQQLQNNQEIGNVFTQQKQSNDQEIENAFRKKLVSASLMLVAQCSQLLRKKQMKLALREWMSFVKQTQVAERAFNKILEINHQHSFQRFATALSILQRVDQKVSQKSMLSTLKLKTGTLFSNNKLMSTDGINIQKQNVNHRNQNKSQSSYKFQDKSPYEMMNFNQQPNTLNKPVNSRISKKDYSQSSNNLIVQSPYREQVYLASIPKLDLKTMGSLTNEIEEGMFKLNKVNNKDDTMNTFYENQGSEFSLGNGTKDLIRFKAEGILEDARNQFKKEVSYRQYKNDL